MEKQRCETTQNKLKKMTDEALESLCDSLEKGKSDELVKYLDVMSRFPCYSFRNLLLILMQNPEATRVMGYQAWKKIGRQVRRSEKAIRIFAPMKIKENKNASLGKLKRGEGKEAEETLLFRLVCVFDVSQTEGEPLPELSEVSGDPGAHLAKLKRFAENRGIKLGYEKDLQADGVSRCGEIVLQLGLDPAVEFHVLAHELGHEMLHEKENRKELTKRQAETEAEAVAFVVSRSIGLNTGHAASDYIQIWKGDEDTLGESLKVIQKTASVISQAILN